MTIRNIFFILPIISLLFLAGCKKNKVQDPKSCAVNISDSSFVIQELIGLDSIQRFFECDTISASRRLTYFTAKDTTGDEYVWNFEGDPRVFSGKSVSFRLDQPINDLNITLTIKRNSSNTCFNFLPHSIEYSKKLTVVETTNNPILGKYYGYNKSNPAKYFSILLLLNGLKNLPDSTTGNYYLQNEIIYGSSAFYIAGAGTYDPDNGAFATQGFGFLKDHNKLEIDYTFKRPTSSNGYMSIKDTFYGIKQ